MNQDPICPPGKDLYKSISCNSPTLGSQEIKKETFINEAGWIFHNFLRPEECKKVIELTEKHGFQKADTYCFLYRDRRSDRVLVDDTYLSKLMWERVRDQVKDLTAERSGKKWEPCGVNPRLRVCRYVGGENHFFGEHVDGGYTDPETGETSFLTLLVYLNSQDEFEGGCTNFRTPKGSGWEHYSVVPQPGLCTVFFQDDRRCLHAGEPVTKGKKYIMRTDIMFKPMS